MCLEVMGGLVSCRARIAAAALHPVSFGRLLVAGLHPAVPLQFIYDMWWASFTPDREFPAEVGAAACFCAACPECGWHATPAAGCAVAQCTCRLLAHCICPTTALLTTARHRCAACSMPRLASWRCGRGRQTCGQ